MILCVNMQLKADRLPAPCGIHSMWNEFHVFIPHGMNKKVVVVASTLQVCRNFKFSLNLFCVIYIHILSLVHRTANLKGHSSADWPIFFSRSVKSLIYNSFTYKVWTLNFYHKGSEIWSFILMLGNSKLCR